MYKKLTSLYLKRIACFIPIRSGSKRIPNKNILKINNQPLIKYVCKKIIKSKLITEFYIGSDNYSYYQKIGKLKKKIQYFKRSKISSSEKSPSEEVILEFLKENKKIDILVFIQVTNPFVHHKYIDEAIAKLIYQKYDSIFSAVKSVNFLWKNKKKTTPINYNYKKRKMSQSLKGYFVENGSFYIFYRKNFIKFKNRLHGKIGVYEMPKKSIHEIDNKEDIHIVRKILS